MFRHKFLQDQQGQTIVLGCNFTTDAACENDHYNKTKLGKRHAKIDTDTSTEQS
jgi:hypothetical protein